MTAHALDVPRRYGVRQTRTGLLTAAPLCAMIPIVNCGVRTAIDPQASGPAYKANHAKNLLYGDNGLGAGAYSHPLPSDKRFFRSFHMTGLSRGEPAQALTI